MTDRISGIEAGQWRLNGPQTTGRDYRNLSQPAYSMVEDLEVPVPDVDEKEHPVDVTAGYLRASLRKVDKAASKPGAPVLPCNSFETVPTGEKVGYRILLVPNSRRFRVGHTIRVFLTTDDQDRDIDVPRGFRHASIGTSSHLRFSLHRDCCFPY